MKTTRRRFIKKAAGSVVAAPFIIPSHVWAAPPSEKINLACVGAGGRGGSVIGSMRACKNSHVVALCDVDFNCAARQIKRNPHAQKFRDFRKMFDKVAKDIDAVTVAIPDHMHFPAAMHAMSLGKHVYVEKPLTHSFLEAEMLMKAEKKFGVVTQMGNQGHTSIASLQFKTWVERGIIKDITKVDAWKRASLWFQRKAVSTWPDEEPVPTGMDWDLWCGPAKVRPFSKMFHPFNWRGYYLYGNGMLGDWGAHIIDFVHHYLKLGLPTLIESIEQRNHNHIVFPTFSKVKFTFPERGPGMPELDLVWADGNGSTPPRPPELEVGKLRTRGKLLYGRELTFLGGTHGDTTRIIPDSKARELGDRLKIENQRLNHFESFIDACKGKGKTWSPFSVSAELSQVLLLGIVCQYLNTSLRFDRGTKRFIGNSEANRLLDGPPPRKGWDQYYRMV